LTRAKKQEGNSNMREGAAAGNPAGALSAGTALLDWADAVHVHFAVIRQVAR